MSHEQVTKSYTDLLFKELDVIQDVIKNLDDIIHKSKNFAFLTWGGSLYLITQHLEITDATKKGSLILLTAIIPLLFWAMDYSWRKHILQCSMRIRIISLFINSPEFVKMTTVFDEDNFRKFPFYDPVGWIYTQHAARKDPDLINSAFDQKYLLDESQLTMRKILFYKDAYIFYGTMIILSSILGLIMITS